MTRDFSPIEFDPTEHGISRSEDVYNQLRQDLVNSKHGSRFEIRDFNPHPTNGTPSPQNVDTPYIAPTDTTDDYRHWIANQAHSLVMLDDDWAALTEGFKTVYSLPDVQDHMSGGGVVKFVDSHRTYTGQVIQEIASWTALHGMGIEAPQEIQTTIVSRMTSLFKLSLIVDLIDDEEEKEKHGQTTHHDGAIIEDVLLPFGGVLLTLPNSQSGNKLVNALQGGLETRRDIVGLTKIAHERLVQRGGSSGQIFFEGSSGTENFEDREKGFRIIGEVRERTSALTTDYNQTEGAEKVMVVGVFMESNPYTDNPKLPILPKPTPFAFLEPRFPKSKRDFDDIMVELATAGTIVKASGELPYQYEKFMMHKRRHPIPNILLQHTV